MSTPRLYGELAEWFHALTHPDDYEEEAAFFRGVFEEHTRPVRTVLELGSGGGNNACHLKAHYEMTLTDSSEHMLAQSLKLNPECRHVQGDMRTLRLGQTFDAVFVHDAVAYMTIETDLRAAMTTAFVHLESEGIALFVPDDTTETFGPSTSTGGNDTGGKSLRYEMRQHAPKPGATYFETTFEMTLCEGDKEWTEHDEHTLGLFPRATWLRLLAEVGFEAHGIDFPHSEFAGETKEIFVGITP